MSLDFKNVINPTGPADNHIVRELFDDISLHQNQQPRGSNLTPKTDVTIKAAEGAMVAPYYTIQLNKVLKIEDGGHLFIGGGSQDYAPMKILQVVNAFSNAPFTTTSDQPQETNCKATITPKCAYSKIIILASGTLRNNAWSNTAARVSLYRDSTRLNRSSELYRLSSSTAFSTGNVPCFLAYLDDFHGSTTSISYAVRIFNVDNTTTIGFNPLINGETFMMLIEVV